MIDCFPAKDRASIGSIATFLYMATATRLKRRVGECQIDRNKFILCVSGERKCEKEKWYALTGRIVDAKVEVDGDIHMALEDATGNNVGTVSAEIPVGPKWCEIRQGGWE
jgi:hypothetical protein